MNKTWMLIAAGILNIISGVVQLLVAIVAFRWVYIIDSAFTEYVQSPEYTLEGYLLRFFIPFFLSGVLAIGGGINAVKREKMLVLVWVGAIAASFPLLISWSFIADPYSLVFGNKEYALIGITGIISLILIGQYEIDLIEKCQAGIRAIWENWSRIVQRWWTEKTKMQRTRSVVFIVIVLALLFRVALWGIPIPFFCSPYYTQTYFRDIDVPNPPEFANFLEQDGWEVSTNGGFDSAMGHVLVHAKKEPFVFFSKPKVSVRLYSYTYIPSYPPKEGKKGQISFFIYEGTGNRVANRIVFNDFVKKINDNFNLNLSLDRYNYIRYCD